MDRPHALHLADTQKLFAKQAPPPQPLCATPATQISRRSVANSLTARRSVRRDTNRRAAKKNIRHILFPAKNPRAITSIPKNFATQKVIYDWHPLFLRPVTGVL